MSQPESKLSRDIMDALRARGVWCFKVHGGPTMMAGPPDIVSCVPFRMSHAATVGLWVGFETKTPTGGDPTTIQKHIHRNIRSAYGLVYVVRSVQDAVDALEYTWAHQYAPDPR